MHKNVFKGVSLFKTVSILTHSTVQNENVTFSVYKLEFESIWQWITGSWIEIWFRIL